MNFLKAFTVVFILLISTVSAIAQRGTVTGIVLDDATGEPLASAIVTCPTSSGGGYSDFEGKFNASFDAGTRTVSIKLVSYEEELLENIVVPKGGTVDVGTIRLKTKAEDAVKGGVTVRVKKKTDTESALITAQKKAVNIMEGTSAQAMSKVGAGDAAEASSKIAGVSIEGGKYVFVRGLGDRYTKTVLNGMELPGLDPDKNTVQMDIFPTSLIDNIVVLKSFTPNLSGDFTGGWVDVKTKDFRAEEAFDVSLSLGYNPAMHFNSNYISHTDGFQEFLGLGAMSRRLPFDDFKSIPRSEFTQSNGGAERAEANANAFSKNMAAVPQTSLMNTSFGISYGNQLDKNKKTYGYNLALGYSNNTTYYENARYETYLLDENKDNYELIHAENNNGQVGQNEVLWSALANGSMKKEKNSYSATLFHTQNGAKATSFLLYENLANPFGDAGATLERNILYYNQRSLSSLLLSHSYNDPEEKWTVNTKFSPSFSANLEPDMRITELSLEDETYRFNVGAGSTVDRLYRQLFEGATNLKVDAEKLIDLDEKGKRQTKLKFGLGSVAKGRDFGVVQYIYRPVPGSSYNLTGDPNQIFEENLFDANTGFGFTVAGEPIPSNEFFSTLFVQSAYVMNEMPYRRRWNFIYGVRAEKADMFYTGEDISGEKFDGDNVLNELNVLPSLNVLFKHSNDLNIRFAATRTLARPSFKEKSNAQIIDPISNRTFIGNLDLEQTEVTNLDFRTEYYMKPGEILSVGAFYKHFVDPIELQVFQANTPTNFTPRNAENGSILGAEFELKKSLEALSPSLKGLFVATNVSYFVSEVTRTQQEFDGRKNEVRTGEEISETRQMQGQAPYIVNAILNYEEKDLGLNLNLSYNVQGPTLAIVGIGRLADVYTMPFHSVNFKGSYAFGMDDRSRLSLSVTNFLGDDRLQVYRSFEAQDQVFTQLLPQQTFQIGYSYKIK